MRYARRVRRCAYGCEERQVRQETQRLAPRAGGGDRRPLGGRVDEVPEVRRWASRLLAGHPRVDDVLLVVSELAANAVLHALTRGETGEVRLIQTDAFVEVRVRSPLRTGTMPRVRRAEDLAESGRGLLLVEALADDWGTRADGGWVTVWARFTAEADA